MKINERLHRYCLYGKEKNGRKMAGFKEITMHLLCERLVVKLNSDIHRMRNMASFF